MRIIGKTRSFWSVGKRWNPYTVVIVSNDQPLCMGADDEAAGYGLGEGV